MTTRPETYSITGRSVASELENNLQPKPATSALLQVIDVFSKSQRDLGGLGNRRSVSLLGGTVNLKYWESILSDSIRASVTFTDAGNTIKGKAGTKVGAVEGLPIEGSEEVYLKFTDNNGTTLKFGSHIGLNNDNFLYVNKITALNTGSETTDKSYKLDLVPAEWITNEKGGQEVRKAFSGQISDHVKTIFKEVLKTKKKFHIEETQSTLDFCGNNTKPYYTLNDLATKAVSKYIRGSGYSAGYFFWETADGYYFRSIDSLMGQGHKTSIIYNESPGTPAAYDVKALSVETDNKVNVQKKLQMGTYSTRFLGLDPFTGIWTNTLTEAEKNERGDMIELAGKDLPSLNKRFNRSEADTEFSRTSFLFGTTGQLNVGKIDGQFDKSKEINFDAPKIFNQAVMRYNQLFASQIIVVIPGDFSLHAGDSVFVDLPQDDVTDNKACGDEIDRRNSGNYLITDLCHYVDASDTYTKLVLTRDSFGRKGIPQKGKVKTKSKTDLMVDRDNSVYGDTFPAGSFGITSDQSNITNDLSGHEPEVQYDAYQQFIP